MAPAGTVTLMFTDVVGSTELLGRLGEEPAEEAMRRHFAMLRAEVARTSGREVKSLGDGLMVAFSSAAEAVDCAVAMQRSAAEHHDGLGLRVGLHAGEPTVDAGDYFGTAVVIARRLCDRARGGEILVSEVVRGLVGRRGGHRFERLGDLDLKGLEEAVAACAVHWRAGGQPEATTSAVPTAQPPLPPALAERRATAFVGRVEALTRLRRGLNEAQEHRLRLVAVSGEPGIGKTRLAREFAAQAYAGGAAVLYGRAEEEGLVPYQPFAEAVRGYLRAAPDARPAATALGHLVPELEPRAEVAAADPSLQRYMLFEAVTGFLTKLSEARPVVLVLDDLHWADAPTLLLLRHAVRGAHSARLLILATYRETDLSRRHPLAEALADLRREGLVERVALRGLGESDIAELLTRTAGHQVPMPFVRALHDETEGNPFFLEEVLRHLVESGTIYERDGHWTSDRPIEQMGIPEGVREAVGRRLSRLSETCNRALSAAAVLGRAWDFELLSEMVDEPDEALLDAVEAALAAQLLVASGEEARPVYSFTHALVRETLYEELSLPRRQRMHLRAAEAIERVHARDLNAHASALALHLRTAGAAADPAKALEWSLRAGAVAAEALAWEEAEDHLEAALEHMEEVGTPPAERARLRERVADLKYVAGSDLEGAVRHLEHALRAYESAGMPNRAARVHSRIARDRATFFGPTHDVAAALEHIEAARPVLDEEPEGVPMAFLLIAEATALIWKLEEVRLSLAASERAMAIADRLGNEPLWSNAAALAANDRAALGQLQTGRDLVEEAWQVANRLNHPWCAFLAAWTGTGIGFWVDGPREALRYIERELTKPRVAGALGQRAFLTLLQAQARADSGDLAGAHAALEEAGPPSPWGFDAVVRGLRGDVEEARAHYERTLEASGRAGNRWTDVAVGIRLAELLAMAGDPHACELVETCAALAGDARHRVLELSARAHAAAHSVEWGVPDRGRAHLEYCRDTMAGREDWGFIAARAEWAGGVLAADEGEAEACFARALQILERLGMPVVQAKVLRAYGLRLADRDPDRALERIDRALELYARMGMGAIWLDRLRADREHVAAVERS